MIPLSYGLGTLVALWAFGGGDSSIFWSRQIWLALVLLVLGVNVVLLQKRKAIFKGHSGSLMIGAGSALATSLPLLVIIWAGKHFSPEAIPTLSHALAALHPPSFLAILIAAFLLSPGHEIISRGILAPAWGLSSVAFLDALTVGFGMQLFVPFLLYWAMGYFWGYLSKQFGFLTALISHSLWTLILLSALFYL